MNGDPNGNNATADNGGTTTDEAENPGEDLQASPERHATPEGIPEDLDPDDLFEGADHNYLPESEEDESLNFGMVKSIIEKTSNGKVPNEAEIRASGRYDSGNYRGKGKSKNYDSDDEKKMKKFFKKKDNSASKSSSICSSRNPSKSSSNRKNTSRKAKAYIGKKMDSDEEESSNSEEADDTDEDSDSIMAGIACASSPATNFF
nr:uncharacterized protein LOC109735103 [Aegilops tauschii subsp. strangulata]